MGRKSKIVEANNLAVQKKTFVFLLHAKIDIRAKKHIVIIADDLKEAVEYAKETYPLFDVSSSIPVQGAVII